MASGTPAALAYLCALLLACGNCFAGAPTIKYLIPSALAPGHSTEVTFFGSDLSGAATLWTSFDAKAENIRCAEDRAVFKVAVPRNYSAGLGAVRLAATNGISSLQLIMIDKLPTIEANTTNNSITTAQELKLPVAVDGACEEKQSRFFKFAARKGQRLSFEVVAQRLGSIMDPLARLLDSAGRELLFCEDTPGAGVDCRFTYKFGSSGQFLLELRDTRYDGGRQYRYRLRAGDFPLESAPLPFHMKPEFKTPVSSPPEIAAAEPNDVTPRRISVPACINGRLGKAKERDCFQFEAKKGERLFVHGKSRSLGSPCDLYLRLETADGKKLADSPVVGAEEGSLTNTFKEAGMYQLVIEEAAQLGGPEFFYRVEIEPYRPGVALSVDTETFHAPSHGTFEIKVSPERRDYDGPITLALEGVPEGFALEKNVLTSKTNDMTVKVTLPTNLAPGQLLNFKIIGHAKIDGKDFVTTVSTRPALRKLFPHQSWPPAELDGWMALGVTTSKPKLPDEKKE